MDKLVWCSPVRWIDVHSLMDYFAYYNDHFVGHVHLY